MKVKICGVTLADDAARVSAAGADYVGVNLWKKSKRFVAPARAPILVAAARAAGDAKLVGLFVDAEVDDVIAAANELMLDVIQLHGDESPDDALRIGKGTGKPVWKALPIARARDVEHLHAWPAAAILLDAPTPTRGGAGMTFDWTYAAQARRRHPTISVVLAGGLTPDNVAAAIAAVDPWCVDVASGVELAPGVKDAAKVTAFIAAARAARGATRG